MRFCVRVEQGQHKSGELWIGKLIRNLTNGRRTDRLSTNEKRMFELASEHPLSLYSSILNQEGSLLL